MTETSGDSFSGAGIDTASLAALIDAAHRYFDLMYDCDLSRFGEVFAPTVQLHGYRDGQIVCWSADTYKDILAKRQSPKSCGATRADEILTIDLAARGMAFVKVRLKINAMTFVDYLTWHMIEGRWLVTSKGFHLTLEADAADPDLDAFMDAALADLVGADD